MKQEELYERVKVQGELVSATKLVKTAAVVKNQFLANMSNEVGCVCDFKNGEKFHLMLLLLYFSQTRIPLNAILGLTTHLFDSPLTGTEQ